MRMRILRLTRWLFDDFSLCTYERTTVDEVVVDVIYIIVVRFVSYPTPNQKINPHQP